MDPPTTGGNPERDGRHSAITQLDWPRVDNSGAPTKCYENARLALLNMGLVFEHNRFAARMRITMADGSPKDLTDDLVLLIRQAIVRCFDFDPGVTATREAAHTLCLEHGTNPVLAYLDDLQWDGTRRLDTWLINHLGADDTPLNRSIGRLTLIAAVRRVRHPGTKFDQMVVLESPEGYNKSTAIEALAGGAEYFTDARLLDVPDKSRAELIQGKWLVECADLTGMAKSEVECLKAYLSRRVDNLRPAYARYSEGWPRVCIFFGTTNDREYLRSQTGNRRFWPVEVGRIDVGRLLSARDQLWAEAAHAEAQDESITLPETLWGAAAVEQEARRERDPWEDVLADARGIEGGDFERVFTKDLLTSDRYLGIKTDRVVNAHSKRLANVMRHLGWDGPRDIRVGRRCGSGYQRQLVGGTPGLSEVAE